MNKDRYTSIAEQLDAMDEPHLAELVEQVTRMRQSLREARELIEELRSGGVEYDDDDHYKVMQVSSSTLDAARRWLEENGDA